jgi:pimeloyl-ACP methyl ester carboxylesterase
MTIRSADVIRATVVAGQTSTGYLLAGAGPPVVLLAARSPDPALIGALAGRFRVIAPEVPKDVVASEFREWLDGFIDGLGLPVVSLVTDGMLESTALDYADAVPDRIRMVVACNPSGGIDLSRLTASLGA